MSFREKKNQFLFISKSEKPSSEDLFTMRKVGPVYSDIRYPVKKVIDCFKRDGDRKYHGNYKGFHGNYSICSSMMDEELKLPHRKFVEEITISKMRPFKNGHAGISLRQAQYNLRSKVKTNSSKTS